MDMPNWATFRRQLSSAFCDHVDPAPLLGTEVAASARGATVDTKVTTRKMAVSQVRRRQAPSRAGVRWVVIGRLQGVSGPRGCLPDRQQGEPDPVGGPDRPREAVRGAAPSEVA